MPDVGVSMRFLGPLWREGGPQVHQATQDAVRDLVAEGEREVKLQLYPGHGLVTGHYRRSVHGEMTSTLHGTIHDSRVVYGPWLEGTGSRNQRSRFKGYRMFRIAKQKLERIKMRVLKDRIQAALRRIG